MGGEGRGNRLFEFLLCLSSGGFRVKGLQRCRMSVLLWRSQGFVYEVYQYDVFVRFQGLELQRLQGFRFACRVLQRRSEPENPQVKTRLHLFTKMTPWSLLGNGGMDPYSSPYIILYIIHSPIPYYRQMSSSSQS